MTPDEIRNPVPLKPMEFNDEFFYLGVLAALWVVHFAGEDTLHDEIVNTCNVEHLLEVAKKHGQLRDSGMTAWKKRNEWKS